MKFDIKLLIKRNQFLIIFTCYVSIISVRAKRNRSCDDFLSENGQMGQILRFNAPLQKDFSTEVLSESPYLDVEAVFTYDQAPNTVQCFPLQCDSRLTKIASQFLPIPYQKPVLRLTPIVTNFRGVQFGDRIEYRIDFIGEPLWYDLFRLTVKGKTVCENQSGKI